MRKKSRLRSQPLSFRCPTKSLNQEYWRIRDPVSLLVLQQWHRQPRHPPCRPLRPFERLPTTLGSMVHRSACEGGSEKWRSEKGCPGVTRFPVFTRHGRCASAQRREFGRKRARHSKETLLHGIPRCDRGRSLSMARKRRRLTGESVVRRGEPANTPISRRLARSGGD